MVNVEGIEIADLAHRISMNGGDAVLINRLVLLGSSKTADDGMFTGNGVERVFSDAYMGRIAGKIRVASRPTLQRRGIPGCGHYTFKEDLVIPVRRYVSGPFFKGVLDLQKRGRVLANGGIPFSLDEVNGAVGPQPTRSGLYYHLAGFEVLVGEQEIMEKVEEYKLPRQKMERLFTRV